MTCQHDRGDCHDQQRGRHPLDFALRAAVERESCSGPKYGGQDVNDRCGDDNGGHGRDPRSLDKWIYNMYSRIASTKLCKQSLEFWCDREGELKQAPHDARKKGEEMVEPVEQDNMLIEW